MTSARKRTVTIHNRSDWTYLKEFERTPAASWFFTSWILVLWINQRTQQVEKQITSILIKRVTVPRMHISFKTHVGGWTCLHSPGYSSIKQQRFFKLQLHGTWSAYFLVTRMMLVKKGFINKQSSYCVLRAALIWLFGRFLFDRDDRKASSRNVAPE